MTEKEAVELLKHHSFTHEDIDHPKSEKGFLGMLRPFQGELIENNFHELMEIAKVLKQQFYKDNIDRQIISNFWGICYLSRAWAVDQGGMLRRNGLISDTQIELLSTWIDCISYTIMNLLDGLPDEEAFETYKFYLADKNKETEERI
ncbi:hypothetical protein GCM10027048_11120 [Hymenobacter coalescens]